MWYEEALHACIYILKVKTSRGYQVLTSSDYSRRVTTPRPCQRVRIGEK